MKIQKSAFVCNLLYRDEKIIEKQNSVIMLMAENNKDEKEFNEVIKQYPKMFIQKSGIIPKVSYENGKIVEKQHSCILIEAESDEDESNIIEIIKKYSN